jgi:hypothetical protein
MEHKYMEYLENVTNRNIQHILPNIGHLKQRPGTEPITRLVQKEKPDSNIGSDGARNIE